MSDYNDDRPGWMRVHIAEHRARKACELNSHAALKAHLKRQGLAASGLSKRLMAWNMAQAGLIDPDGRLRDGYPAPESGGSENG